MSPQDILQVKVILIITMMAAIFTAVTVYGIYLQLAAT